MRFLIHVSTNWCGMDQTYRAEADSEMELWDIAEQLAYENFQDYGWFIVMADLPTGQVSNHYRIEEWNLFKVPIKDKADIWDGHTSVEAANRLYEFCLYYSNPI